LIEANSTLKTVNAQSNRLTGPVITQIVRSTLKNQTLIELRLSNQVSKSFKVFSLSRINDLEMLRFIKQSRMIRFYRADLYHLCIISANE
jgi:hypothetical protein